MLMLRMTFTIIIDKTPDQSYICRCRYSETSPPVEP